MKNILIFIFVLLTISSTACKKQTNTIIKNDTTIKIDTFNIDSISYIYTNSSLIGRWAGSGGISVDTFQFYNTYYTQSPNYMYNYVTSPTIIYRVITGEEIYDQYAYSISSNNDTLTLSPTISPLVYIYYRIH